MTLYAGLRIVKVGGSLFDLNDLYDRLWEWLSGEPPLPTLLVAGGGAQADLVRAADQRWNLGPDIAHQLALEAMTLNGRLLAALLTKSSSRDFVVDAEQLDRWLLADMEHSAAIEIVVVDLGAILAAEELRAGRPLVERSWRVTSDSLAAWLGSVLTTRGHQVDLVLLKSIDIDEKKTLAEHQQAGAIDECFSEYAAGILRDVRFVNLRGG